MPLLIFPGLVLTTAWILAVALFLVSCDKPQDPSPLAPLPESQAYIVESQGVRFQAVIYGDSSTVTAELGADVLGAGLLPLRLTFQNNGSIPVRLLPRQIFLIDEYSQAWPLLTADQAARRLQHSVDSNKRMQEAAESFTAFAVDLVRGVGFSQQSNPIGEQEKQARSSILPFHFQNPAVLPRQSASALLFFPMLQNGLGTKSLRIGYEQAGRTTFLALPLKAHSQ